MGYRVDKRTLITLMIMFLAVLFLWDYAVLYPVKLFVVLLHESGHALAAVLTGGQAARIELSSKLGGTCISRGGSRFAILSAGYLGSMLLGALILVGASRSRYDREISLGIGIGVVLVTLALVRNGFGLVFGLLFGAAMIFGSRVFGHKVNDLVLKFLGLTSALYAIIDIKEDLVSRTVPGSDAYRMSVEFFLPPLFWGVFWIVLAVLLGVVLVRLAVRKPCP